MAVLGWIALGLMTALFASGFRAGDEGRSVLVVRCVLAVVGALVGGLVAVAAGVGAIGDFFHTGTWLIALGGAILALFIHELWEDLPWPTAERRPRRAKLGRASGRRGERTARPQLVKLPSREWGLIPMAGQARRRIIGRVITYRQRTPADGTGSLFDRERPDTFRGPGLLGGKSLLTRIFLANAVVLLAAVVALAISPITVSDPVALREAGVLVAGLTVLLLVNLTLFRRAFAPLAHFTELMRTVDPLQPGRRVPVHSDDGEVAELARGFNEMLDRLEHERRQSTRRSLNAQEGERRRVARELHDEIGQSLTAMVLQLDRLYRMAPEHQREEHAAAREAARATLEEVRQIAQRLRPEALDELGLQTALATLAGRVSEHGRLRVLHRLDANLPDLSPAAELVIYRVAQEALTNVLRHAGASQAALTLRGDAEGVTLQVTDDGRGLDGSRPGAGIQGMRERALLVDAALEVRSGPRRGTELRLKVPCGAP